ncbi:MAG: hypothetical protein ABJA98_04385 [Acidobacteriota bacterium]
MTPYVYLVAFLAAAAAPLLFLALFAVFRWRYARMIRGAIYPGAPFEPDSATATVPAGRGDTPLTLRWSDAADIDGPSRSQPAEEARRETLAMRTAFAAAGIVYIALSMAMSAYRDRDGGLLNGYISSLPAFVIASTFAGLGWSVTLATAISWSAVLLMILANDLGANEALPLVFYAFTTIAPQLIAVLLLVPRTARALLVGFVPALALIGVLSLAALPWLMAIDTTSGEDPSLTLVLAAGAIALGVGTALAAIGIRRSQPIRFGALLLAMGVFGILAKGPFAVVGSAGFNGLLALAVWPGMRRLMDWKQRGLAPDEVLHFALCLLVPSTFPSASGWSVWQWLPFAASLSVLIALLGRRRMMPRRAAPKRLLLLRVFGPQRVSNWLLDALDDGWRRAGIVDLVVGLDVALRTVGAAALENFLLGRAVRQFIATDADIRRHLDVAPPARPAIDGRFPLNEWYCLPETWPGVVERLACAADVVLMDLRGFGETHRGVIYELSLLMRRVALERVVLLTDSQTNDQLLSDVLQRARTALTNDSPNAAWPDLGINLLRCSGRRPADTAAITGAVFAAVGEGAPNRG